MQSGSIEKPVSLKETGFVLRWHVLFFMGRCNNTLYMCGY